MNLHDEPQLFVELIQVAASSCAIPEIYVEKDYWVTKVLKRLHESELINQIVFKGGTSLSKAHQLINRFSEDIDLAAKCSGFSQSEIRNLLRRTEATVTVDLEYQKNHERESKGSKFRKTVYTYPTEISGGNFGQVADKILLEVNAFANPKPAQPMSIGSLIHETLAGQSRSDLIQQYNLNRFEINVLCVERTLCEKIMGLVRACHEEDPKAELKRLIRHFYDLCMILRRDEYQEYITSDAFANLMHEVRENDRELVARAENWLARPAHEAEIFSKSSAIWSEISPDFRGNFRQMLYDDDLPSDEEVISVLSTLRDRLAASH